MDKTRWALIREVTNRPKITLKELQSFTAEAEVFLHSTTPSLTPCKAGFWSRGDRESHCLKKENKQVYLKISKRHQDDTSNMWKKVL